MVGAVFIVLLFGLVNMLRGGSPNVSQKLMRLRVVLQVLVVCGRRFWSPGWLNTDAYSAKVETGFAIGIRVSIKRENFFVANRTPLRWKML